MPFLILFAAVALLFFLAPGIDLAVTDLFWDPARGFFLNDAWWERVLYGSIPWVVGIAVLGSLAVLVPRLARRLPLGRGGRVAILLLAVMAIGPGLTVNAILKDHWGRARPRDVAEFGGERRFTAAPVIAHQCGRNCSFSAGHPSAAFALAALAYGFTDRRRRRTAFAAAIGFGTLVGLARIVEGGHFLSDVVYSGFIVTGLTLLLARPLLGPWHAGAPADGPEHGNATGPASRVAGGGPRIA